MCNANSWRGKRSNYTTCESPNYGSGTQGRSNRPCSPESPPAVASPCSPPHNTPSRASCSWSSTCSSTTYLGGHAPQKAQALPPSDPPRSAKPPQPPTPQLACTSTRSRARSARCALVSCLLLLPFGTCTSMACASTVCMAMGLHTGHWTHNSMLHLLARCAPGQ